MEDAAAGYVSAGVFDPNPVPAVSPAMYSGQGEIAASWLVVHPTTFRHDVYGAVF